MSGFSLPELPPRPTGGASDAVAWSAYWEAVRRLYRVTGEAVNLENGYWGVMAEPVLQEYLRQTDRINRDNTWWVRRHWPDELERLREAVAGALGCASDELLLTRGASEGLLAAIGGYNRLVPGDQVLYSDLDYPAMQHAMAWLRERRSVEPVRLTMPEPATRENVLAAYREALARLPRVRLVLLTHLSHSTGLVLPMRELGAMVREAGAEAIVDAAHSWGQLDIGVADLHAPIAGFNLHKWIGAPLGCGALYIRRGHLASVDRHLGSEEFPADDIRSRLYTGTPNFAAWLTLPAALALHRHIGPATKAARLRQLRDRWVSRVRGLPGVQVLTPDDPGLAAGITSFRGVGPGFDGGGEAWAVRLRERHGLHTVCRSGLAGGDVLRVTPALYNTEADMDRLAGALCEMAGVRA